MMWDREKQWIITVEEQEEENSIITTEADWLSISRAFQEKHAELVSM